MSKILQFVKDLNDRRKKNNARRNEQMRKEIIENKFSLSCRDGKLFILCGSTAVETLRDDETVKDVLQRIEAMKKSEMEFTK